MNENEERGATLSGYMEFKGFRLVKLNYEIKDEEKTAGKESTNIKFNIGYALPEEDSGKTGFLLVSCAVDQFRAQDKMEIEVMLEGAFSFTNQDPEFIKEFIRLNGTTILMPYIRNVISMVSGYDTTKNHFLLPTVNVQQLFETDE